MLYLNLVIYFLNISHYCLMSSWFLSSLSLLATSLLFIEFWLFDVLGVESFNLNWSSLAVLVLATSVVGDEGDKTSAVPFNNLLSVVCCDTFCESVPLTLLCFSARNFVFFDSCHCGMLGETGAGGNWDLNKIYSLINKTK